MRVLVEPADIDAAQMRFESLLRSHSDRVIPVYIGHQGDSFEETVHWCEDLGIWHCCRRLESRYWNAFGIGEPRECSNLPITCEINIPLRGLNRHVAGIYLRDNTGNLYIGHRGKIGGGRRGIGKALFRENYAGEWVEIEDHDRLTDVALVATLDSDTLGQQVAEFVREVARIKALAAR